MKFVFAKCFTIVAFLWLPFSILGQVDSLVLARDSVVYSMRLDKGDKQTYCVKRKETTNFYNYRLQPSSLQYGCEYFFKVSVKSCNDSTCKVNVQYQKFKADSIYTEKEYVTAKYIGLNPILEVLVTKEGTFLEILEIPRLITLFNKQTWPFKAPDSIDYKGIIEVFEKDLTYVFGSNNAILKFNNNYEVDASPFKVGNISLRQKGFATLNEINQKKGYFVFNVNLELDTLEMQSFKKLLFESCTNISANYYSEHFFNYMNTVFDKYNVSLANGWVRNVLSLSKNKVRFDNEYYVSESKFEMTLQE